MPIGEAIIYMITMVAQIGVGIVVGAYLSHHFLVIVELTAAGHDRMTWPKEPYKDWLWKPPYLAWLIAFWLAPAGITLKFVKMPFLADSKWLQFIALALPGLWLFFPITLMSSLSATSRWIFFRPAMLKGFARIPGSVLGFYLITLLLLAVCGGVGAIFWGFTTSQRQQARQAERQAQMAFQAQRNRFQERIVPQFAPPTEFPPQTEDYAEARKKFKRN